VWGNSHTRATTRHPDGALRVSGAPQPIHHGLQAPLDAVPGPGADIHLVDPQRLGNRLVTPTYAIGHLASRTMRVGLATCGAVWTGVF